MLQMRGKDSAKLFSSIVREDLPVLLVPKRASIQGHLPLAEEGETASMGIPDSNRGSVDIMCRLAFPNHAYVIKIDLPGSNYRITRESMQLNLH